MKGDFDLTKGEVIKIMAGQKGEDTRATNQDNAAPDGGTMTRREGNGLIIISW